MFKLLALRQNLNFIAKLEGIENKKTCLDTFITQKCKNEQILCVNLDKSCENLRGEEIEYLIKNKILNKKELENIAEFTKETMFEYKFSQISGDEINAILRLINTTDKAKNINLSLQSSENLDINLSKTNINLAPKQSESLTLKIYAKSAKKHLCKKLQTRKVRNFKLPNDFTKVNIDTSIYSADVIYELDNAGFVIDQPTKKTHDTIELNLN